jgi:hypothetical protein
MAENTTADVVNMIAWGALGGALPTLGKIAGTYGANFDAPSPEISGVVIAVALYAVIGSVVSRAMGNPDIKQALFSGIAAPAVVISIVAGASDSKSVTPNTHVSGISLFSSAFAQPAMPGAATPALTRKIEIKVQAATPYPVNGVIQISAKEGDKLTSVGSVQISANSGQTSVQIPTGPTTLVFTSASGAKAQVAVNTETSVLVTITPSTSAASDLKWALGSQRVLDIGALSATAK